MRTVLPSLVVLCVGLLGCGAAEHAPAPSPTPVVQSSQLEAPATKTLPAPVTKSPPAGDPAALYAACEQRVEGADKPAECAVDADCTSAGCSSEMCISRAEADLGVMSTCEVLPCFSVLETCGCDAGVCRWQVGG